MEAIYRQTGELIDLASGTARSGGEIIRDAAARAQAVIDTIAASEAGAVREGGIYDIVSASDVTFSVGDNVYWDASADTAIAAASAGADDFPIGKALVAKASGDTTVRTQLNAAGAGLIRAIAAAGTACTGTTDETTLASVQLPAGALHAGDVLRVRTQAIATATNGTDTLTLKLYVGTEQIVTTGAVDVANNDIGYIDCDVVIRAGGASGLLVAAGVQALGTAGAVTAKPFYKASASEDLSGTVAVALTATWSSSNAGNSCRADIFNVQLLHPGV